ncbi:MAG TPA: methionine adenosyltransferase [Planctomycetes bacterium]|nr:methionine adenosyltransferase [Planctomycetota bacterium]
MSKELRVFTSESVSAGHPDKVSDRISDAVLDACLAQDPKSRVACETLCTTNFVCLAGEITTEAQVDYEAVAREAIADIGYNDPALGFDAKSCQVMVRLDQQSPDISMGVDEGSDKEQGAGDQGLMFGYACKETDAFMPFPIHYSHRILEALDVKRNSGALPWLRPDAKSQLSVVYGEDGMPSRIHSVVVSTQHAPEVGQEEIQSEIKKVVQEVIPEGFLDAQTRYFINPTGRFVIGGPQGDCGLTGRKIIVDTYGGMGRHGGGAFSGKDPSKVDRSAAYAARWVAKNLVAADLADRVEVQVSYAIGVAEPISVLVDAFGTGKVEEGVLEALVREHFDLRPKAIIQELNLLRPIYQPTAAYGHFGRENGEFPWENLNRVEALKSAVS